MNLAWAHSSPSHGGVSKTEGEWMAQPGDAKTIAGWYALDVELEPTATPRLSNMPDGSGLWARKRMTYGRTHRVTGYFDDFRTVSVCKLSGLSLHIYDCLLQRPPNMNVRKVENRDWLAEWKENWQPVIVGRFIIAPPWSEIGPLHESVYSSYRTWPWRSVQELMRQPVLCLAELKTFRGEQSLDVERAQVILAIAAAKLFPGARIEAMRYGC